MLVNGKEIQTDEHGYLRHSEDWSEELMFLMAREDGVDLTPEHIEVIRAVREYYRIYAAPPRIRMLIAFLRKQGQAVLAQSRVLAGLFPSGAAAAAARYAGIPRPAQCV